VRKVPTLFLRDEADRRYVTCRPNPAAGWVFAGEGRATRKFDGTCVRLDELGGWWARREVKPGKAAPPGWQAADWDPVTGKAVGWEPAGQSAYAKVLGQVDDVPDRPGTYELCGPKVNGNPEGYARHVLVPHGLFSLLLLPELTYEALAEYMADTDYEGIVWHHPDGRMAKLKRRDFPAVGR
jgi:hypothetical protein